MATNRVAYRVITPGNRASNREVRGGNRAGVERQPRVRWAGA